MNRTTDKEKSELIPVSKVFNVHDLKSQFRGLSHWFDADSMRFFKTRLSSHFKCLKASDYECIYAFVTTEKKSFSDDSRVGNIRIATVTSIPCNDRNQFYKVSIRSFGEFCSLSPAQAVYQYKKLNLAGLTQSQQQAASNV